MLSLAVLLLILAIELGFVDALPSFLDPKKGSTPAEEMQCYGLPYGGLGFASHLITYYTLVCMWCRVKPYAPWKKLESPWLDFALGAFSMIISVSLATFTIIRCRNRWQFMVIAIWKIFMSATLGFSTISAALSTRPLRPLPPLESDPHSDRTALIRENPGSQIEMTAARTLSRQLNSNSSYQPLGIANTGYPQDLSQSQAPSVTKRSNDSVNWIWLYVPGLITGLVGLFSLVKENWNIHAIRLITYIMWGIPGGLGVLGVIGVLFEGDESAWVRVAGGILGLVGYGIGGLAVFGALYSDWILGAIAGNYAGLPSGDNAWLYWGYFFAKKLPLGSS